MDGITDHGVTDHGITDHRRRGYGGTKSARLAAGVGGAVGQRVDADCDAALEEILADCFASDSGRIGWECGLRLARRAGCSFVAALLETHGDHNDTATGRAELVDLAKKLLVPLAHERIMNEWRTAADVAGLHDHAEQATRRHFKRGMFAGFLFGMADAVSRGIEGRSLVGA